MTYSAYTRIAAKAFTFQLMTLPALRTLPSIALMLIDGGNSGLGHKCVLGSHESDGKRGA
jgi:hypothetical protein